MAYSFALRKRFLGLGVCEVSVLNLLFFVGRTYIPKVFVYFSNTVRPRVSNCLGISSSLYVLKFSL